MGFPKKEGSLTAELLTCFKNKKREEISRSKIGRKQEKRKFPIKDRKKTKEKRKSHIKDRKKMKELYRRVFGPDKYPNNTE